MVRRTVRSIVRNPAGTAALVFLAGLAMLAGFAPLVAPFDPYETDLRRTLEAPAAQNIFGRDELGRDVLSRTLFGARTSLLMGTLTVAIAAIAGTTLGLAAGYAGPSTDLILMRLVDILMAFPGIMLAIVVIAILGPGLTNVVLAVGIYSVPVYARLVRGEVLSICAKGYIDAATGLGRSELGIVLRHILPNCFSLLVVQSTFRLATAILSLSSLSFLGLGTQPPTAEWGTMMGSARKFLVVAPHVIVFPGVALGLTILSLNLGGDAIRDALDPRQPEYV